MTPKPQESGMPLARAMQNSDIACSGDSGFINQGFESEKTVESSTASGSLTLAKIPAKTPEETTGVPKPTDFDDLLPHLGEFGKYQKFLFLCMIPFAFFIAFVYFSQIFITVAPEEHWCRVPELEGLPLMERVALSIPREGSGFSKCQMYDVNYTEILASGIKEPSASWPTAPCKAGWEFNFTDIPYPSITTELEWVCEHSTLPVIAQSIFFVGAIVGGLLFGWIADRFGRIPALVGCNFVGFAAGVATAFVGNFWEFALCRFLVGFAFDNCFTMMYILVLEYVGPKWRTFVANMSIAIFFTAASCALPWIAYFLADWKMLAIVTSAPLALVVLTPLIVPESARWLVSQGKIERAITILKKFERVNKKTIPPQMYKDFSDSCAQMQEEESYQKNFSVLDLFRTPRLRKITILLIIIWMAISLVFDGHVRNVGSLGLDLFITFTVASATELPADTLLTLTLDKWGRRWLACGTMVMSGVFSLLATTVPVGPVFAALAIMGRFSVNISYNIGLQYAAELLPTVVRAQGVAFIHIMGYVASIVAPFVVHLANISPALPLIVLGILGIFGGLLSLFLPETLGHELPQSLTDGEEFGRGQKMWEFPCIGKKADHEDNMEKGETFQRTPARATLRGALQGEMRSNLLRRSLRVDKIST